MKYKKVVSGLFVCSAVLLSAGAFYAQSYFYNETAAKEQAEPIVESSTSSSTESTDSSSTETPIAKDGGTVASSESTAVIEESTEESSEAPVESTTETETSTESSTTESSETSESNTESSTSDSSETTESSTTESSSEQNPGETTESSTPPANDSGNPAPSKNNNAPAENPNAPTTSQQQVMQANQPPISSSSVESNYSYSVSPNKTTAEFIDAIGKDAQEIAWGSDLYASVMIAQAILETGSGNSRLASEPNYNLFGIKGTYEGESVTFKTQEDDGGGNLYTIDASFRKYPSYRESLEDYADLLRNGIQGNRNFYSQTWKSNAPTYQDVTEFLTGRYATDTYYNLKLNALIETYQLTQYDQNPNTGEEAEVEEEVSTENAANLSGNRRVNFSRNTTRRKTNTNSSKATPASEILGTTSANETIAPSVIRDPAKLFLGSMSPWEKIE